MDNPEDVTHMESEGSSAASLIDVLETLVARLPESRDEADERLASALLIRDGLALYGLDAESLVRYAMSGHVAVTLITAILIRPMNPSEDEAYPLDVHRWRELLHVPHDAILSGVELQDAESVREALQAQVTRLRPIIVHWVESAPYEDIALLTPPTVEALGAYQLASRPSPDVVAAYTWILQRSTSDELSHWTNASLFHEFRLQEGETNLHFSSAVLEEGGQDPAALNYEIARRAASPDPGSFDNYDPLIWQLQEQAQTFLRQNRHAEASALFEFYFRLHPASLHALNNLAFCKLPVDPGGALHHLQKADRAGYTPRIINVYNQCCCLSMLSREGEALDRAEYYWQREYEADKNSGVLWNQSVTGWDLYNEQDPKLALANLAQDIAVSIGRSDRALKWQQRAEELRSAWSTSEKANEYTAEEPRKEAG